MHTIGLGFCTEEVKRRPSVGCEEGCNMDIPFARDGQLQSFKHAMTHPRGSVHISLALFVLYIFHNCGIKHIASSTPATIPSAWSTALALQESPPAMLLQTTPQCVGNGVIVLAKVSWVVYSCCCGRKKYGQLMGALAGVTRRHMQWGGGVHTILWTAVTTSAYQRRMPDVTSPSLHSAS